MSEPRDPPPIVVWIAVSALCTTMWWLWPDRDSPRAASDVPVPIPVAGALIEKAATVQLDGTIAEALGLTLNARRQIDRVFGNALALDPVQRASLEIQIDALPVDPSSAALDNIERALHQVLPPEQADLLFHLVRDYRDYVRDVREDVLRQDLPQNQEEADTLFERIDALRRIHFDDAVALALFTVDDAALRPALASRLPQ